MYQLEMNPQIIIVKLDLNVEFEKYLPWFNIITRRKILEYKFRIDQMRSFVSELLKHYYLAKLLFVPPSKIKITYTQLGKPILTDELENVSFSISHSGDYVVLALLAGCQVGIDIEKIDQQIIPSQLGKAVFSPVENSLIADDVANFFMLWSKKEALFKAYGTGFINDYYTKTSLTLNPNEIGDGYKIYSHRFANDYYLSLCILD